MSNVGVLVATAALAAALYGAVAFSRADDVPLRFREPTDADWATVPSHLHHAMSGCIREKVDEHIRRSPHTTFEPGINAWGLAFEACRAELMPDRW